MTSDERSPLGALRRGTVPANILPPGRATAERLAGWRWIRHAMRADIQDVIAERRRRGWSDEEIRVHVAGVVAGWHAEMRAAALRALEDS